MYCACFYLAYSVYILIKKFTHPYSPMFYYLSCVYLKHYIIGLQIWDHVENCTWLNGREKKNITGECNKLQYCTNIVITLWRNKAKRSSIFFFAFIWFNSAPHLSTNNCFNKGSGWTSYFAFGCWGRNRLNQPNTGKTTHAK